MGCCCQVLGCEGNKSRVLVSSSLTEAKAVAGAALSISTGVKRFGSTGLMGDELCILDMRVGHISFSVWLFEELRLSPTFKSEKSSREISCMLWPTGMRREA